MWICSWGRRVLAVVSTPEHIIFNLGSDQSSFSYLFAASLPAATAECDPVVVVIVSRAKRQTCTAFSKWAGRRGCMFKAVLGCVFHHFSLTVCCVWYNEKLLNVHAASFLKSLRCSFTKAELMSTFLATILNKILFHYKSMILEKELFFSQEEWKPHCLGPLLEEIGFLFFCWIESQGASTLNFSWYSKMNIKWNTI